jgi:hypothetical protein
MFNITNHKKNASQKIIESYHFTPARVTIGKKTKITNAGEEMEKEGLVYIVGGNIN